ncbi:MAG: DUF805 domain-containing protein [Bifidobacteriaceae bacterium]|nr:DUF805 domain-containing protein [Bifidobacteriaceae bacterium]
MTINPPPLTPDDPQSGWPPSGEGFYSPQADQGQYGPPRYPPPLAPGQPPAGPGDPQFGWPLPGQGSYGQQSYNPSAYIPPQYPSTAYGSPQTAPRPKSWSGSAADPGLGWPWPGIGLTAAFKRAFKKYGTFSGRASRSEYWWFAVAIGLINLFLLALVMATGVEIYRDYSGQLHTDLRTGGGLGQLAVSLLVLFSLVTFVPSLALLWRRLHDANLSGFLYLLYFVPIAGPIVMLVFLLLPSTAEGARFDR